MPADAATSPTRFAYDESGRALVVEWADGSTFSIPFERLRRRCPCAVCSGEAGAAGRFAHQPDLAPGEDELADIGLVGAYGLNAIWADGHNTGIYTFAFLRQLCEGR